MTSSGGRRLPPLTAYLQQACFKCFREEENDVRLPKCASCKQVAYCGTGCQKADWGMHKQFCKAFKVMESNVGTEWPSFTSIDDLTGWNEQTRQSIFNEVFMLQKALYILRIADIIEPSAKTNPSAPSTTESSQALFPCVNCKTTFFCSAEHEKAANAIHNERPCDEGHDNQTPCQLNQELRGDLKVANLIASDGPFVWAPERTKSSWLPLRGYHQGTSVNSNWNEEFTEDFVNAVGVPPSASPLPLIRAASVALSMPMTILWALQNLKDSDEWTRRDTLTIHVLGASEQEVMASQVFEEILHRLPEVKTLKLILCGPDLSTLFSRRHESSMDMDTCPDCRRKGRKRIHQHYFEVYHELVQRLGTKLSKPDLAIAFNSGASEDRFSWLPTMRYLVDNKINSIFTSYNREEAKEENRILKDMAGAKFLIDVGVNPWGSIKLLQEQIKAVGYYSINRWIAGGF